MSKKTWVTFPDGRKLTMEEWLEYLKEHPHCSREIYINHGDFGFNVHGVCMNPYRVIIHAKPGSMRYGDIASVSICQSPGGWSFACDIHSDISSPHYSKDPDKPGCYNTANEAIFAGLKQLDKYLTQDLHWYEQMEVSRRKREGDDEDEEEKTRNNARIRRIKKLLQETRVKQDYYDPRQLLLF